MIGFPGVIAHNKYSLWASNVIGALKIITLVFISITGLVILGGNVDRVPDPHRNFRNAFDGTTQNGNDLANSLVSIVFSYSGYSNAFNLVNEIQNPIPTLRKNASISLGIVFVLYFLCNIAYFSAGESLMLRFLNRGLMTDTIHHSVQGRVCCLGRDCGRHLLPHCLRQG